MQTDASPWSGQVRLRMTFDGIVPVRHTSAGHDTWQTGQRLLVRLSSLSASRSAIRAGFVRDITAIMSRLPAHSLNSRCCRLITPSRIKRKVCERDQSSHNDSDAALLKCHDAARQTNYAENAFQCAAGNADLDPGD